MPDLLTHVLVVYAVTAICIEGGLIADRYLPLALVGAVMPDAMKVAVLLDSVTGTVAGIPYSLWGIHTLGGVLVLGGIGALTIRASDRRAAFGSLCWGGIAHLVLDLFVIRVDGVAPPYLFPITGWLPPAGNLYASTDAWPLVVAFVLAVPVWLRRVTARTE